jgi:hypothetical protein
MVAEPFIPLQAELSIRILADRLELSKIVTEVEAEQVPPLVGVRITV